MTVNFEKLNKRIDQLCKEKNIKKTIAFIESGAGKNFQSNMKTANPSLGKLTLLANYFNVSVEYLMGESESKEKSPSTEELSPKKKQVMELLDSMSDDQMDLFISIMKETIKNRNID